MALIEDPAANTIIIKEIKFAAAQKFTSLERLVLETLSGKNVRQIKEMLPEKYSSFLARREDAHVLFNHFKKEICATSDVLNIMNWVYSLAEQGTVPLEEVPRQIEHDLFNDAIETIALRLLEKHNDVIANNNKLLAEQIDPHPMKGRG